MVTCSNDTRCWARSGLSFSPQRAHARSTVVTATLFAHEHALREKLLRQVALLRRVQPPGEKCGLNPVEKTGPESDNGRVPRNCQ